MRCGGPPFGAAGHGRSGLIIVEDVGPVGVALESSNRGLGRFERGQWERQRGSLILGGDVEGLDRELAYEDLVECEGVARLGVVGVGECK